MAPEFLIGEVVDRNLLRIEEQEDLVTVVPALTVHPGTRVVLYGTLRRFNSKVVHIDVRDTYVQERLV